MSSFEKTDIASRTDRGFSLIDDFAFTSNQKRNALGPSPAASSVARIVRSAAKCQNDEHSEASWNCMVHTFLLDLALHNDDYTDVVDYLDW